MTLIFVHIGNEFPNYHEYALRQAEKYFSGDILCITGNEANYYLENNENNKIFKKHSFLNKYGLGDFWSVTFQRLFVIEQIMKEKNIDNVYHIENDVLIYEKPEKFEQYLKEKIYVNPLTLNHSTFAYTFFPNVELINLLNIKMLKYLLFGEQKLIEMTSETMINEMVLLKLVYNNSKVILDFFPSLPNNKFNKIIFDPASWGQYIGGTPFHNAGFIDDNHFVGQELRKNKFKIVWKNKEPFVIENETEYKLANLHIHSKQLQKFISYE
jgi:hypothetical protein